MARGHPGFMHILAIDDSAEILSILRRGLQARGYEVTTASDGRSALRSMREIAPDLLILDLRLPDIDGIELCQRIQEVDPVPVIMLTARDSVAERVQGLRAGADDYVVKPFELDELAARIEAVMRRRPRGTSELRHDDLVIDVERRRVTRAGEEIELTRTEFSILEFLTRRADRVIGRQTLAAAVWPESEVVDDTVLDTHVANLRRKLEGAGGRRLLQTIRGVGFTLR